MRCHSIPHLVVKKANATFQIKIGIFTGGYRIKLETLNSALERTARKVTVAYSLLIDCRSQGCFLYQGCRLSQARAT
jgi:hypothetical protein